MQDRYREEVCNVSRSEAAARFEAELISDAAVERTLLLGAKALARSVSNALTVVDVDNVHVGGGVARNATYMNHFADNLRRFERAFGHRKLNVVVGAYENPTLVGAMLHGATVLPLPSSARRALADFVRPGRV
jgi:predicted NBD/HSP70 family sugar kinase